MSSLFNVYKKISKIYGAKSNIRNNSAFKCIPIIQNDNKFLSKMKFEKKNYQRNKDII